MHLTYLFTGCMSGRSVVYRRWPLATGCRASHLFIYRVYERAVGCLSEVVARDRVPCSEQQAQGVGMAVKYRLHNATPHFSPDACPGNNSKCLTAINIIANTQSSFQSGFRIQL